MPVVKSFLSALFVLVLTCPASWAQSGSAPVDNLLKGIGNFISSITSPTGQKFVDLVEKKQFEEAAAFYEQEKQFFSTQGEKYYPDIKTLSDGLNRAREPSLKEATTRLDGHAAETSQASSKWPQVKTDVSTTDKLIKDYGRVTVLQDPRFTSPVVANAKQALDRMQKLYEQAAPDQFAAYDHLGDLSFFDAYPISLDATTIMRDGFQPILSRLSKGQSPQLLSFRTRYSQALSDSQLKQLAELYVEKSLSESSVPNPGFFDKWKTLREARKAGFSTEGIDAFRAAIVEIVPETDNSNVLFPTLSVDLKVNVKKIRSSEFAPEYQSGTENYLLLFRLAPIEMDRKVLAKNEQSSTVQIGTQSIPNPAFVAAQAKFIQAQSQYNAQVLRNATTPNAGGWAAVARGVAEGIAAVVVNNARQELAATPSTLTEPVYRDYKFNVSEIEVTRNSKADVWIIDRQQQTIARHEIPWSDKKLFRIVYNLQEKDPNLYSHRKTYDSEQSLDAFEKQNVPFKVSWLSEQVYSAAPAFSAQSNIAGIALETSITQPVLDKVASRSINAVGATDDSRMDSVVVVRNPNGSLGSGFFVGPDLVLTNHHVVEGSRMAEVKLRNGTEAVGRVIRSDLGLDLALIKVTDGGTPVAFANLVISSGSTVEAIGHPSGLEFSMTRGIVSAVRKMSNPLVPGSREMLVIQTDAAISPGNSGGPLFLGNQVIGVNTQKLIRRGVEGVGFAIHYTEVLRFMQEQ